MDANLESRIKMGLVVRLALCLAWFYEAFFLLLALFSAVIIFHLVGLHPVLVLACLTLLPYIFFLGILPARTLRRAINSGQPNRMLWWVGATWINFGMHLFVIFYVRWSPHDAPVVTYSRHYLTVTTVVIVISQAVVLSAHCSLRRTLPMEGQWEFPSQEEGKSKGRRSSNTSICSSNSNCEKKEEKGEEFWTWNAMMDEGVWRKYFEEERRRKEERAKRRRSEGGIGGSRQGGRRGGEGGKGGSIGVQEGGEGEGRISSREKGEKEEVFRVLSSKSHHHLLKVGQGATGQEVRVAYRHLALLVHPDKNKDPRAGEAFAKLQKAYQCLAS